MTGRALALIVVLVAFGALTALALQDVGYFGIIEPHFQSYGGAQVFFDLVIVAGLSCLWMLDDARKQGGNAWPYVVITLVAGCFGPLLYLLVRELRTARTPSSATAGG
ncbi:MAG: DUF2834 domain-containing protein [Pseudomonadota bacterium]